MENKKSLKTHLYALFPLAAFYLAAGAAGGCLEALNALFLKDWLLQYGDASSLYAARSVWEVLCMVVPAGVGCLAVRGPFLAEQHFALRAFAGKRIRSAGPLFLRRMAVLTIAAAALAVGINVILSLAHASGGSSAELPGFLPGLAGMAVQACVYGIFMPFAEELLFRGTLFLRFRRIYGLPAAVILSSALFGLYHASAAQSFYAFLMGLLFAAAYEKTGRLAVPWALHGTCNLIVLLLQWTDCYGRICTPAWCLAFLGIFAAGFWLVSVRK